MGSSLKQQYQEEAKSLTPLIKSLRHDITVCDTYNKYYCSTKRKTKQDYTR